MQCAAVAEDNPYALLRQGRADGHVLPIDYASGRWNRRAVEAVLASPEADPAGNFAAARAKLNSDVTTTITVAA